jgi:hypothetical protein
LELVDRQISTIILDQAEKQKFIQMYERACIRRLDYRGMVEEVPFYTGIVLGSFFLSFLTINKK